MTQIRFKERQQPAAWVWIVLGLMVAVPAYTVLEGAALYGALVPLVLVLLILFLFFPMVTEVHEDDIRVSFGQMGWIHFTIPFDDITQVQIVTYNPMRTYLGWGIRTGFDRSVCYTMRGKQGVMIEMTDGRKKLIGSQDPNALGEAVEARGPHPDRPA